MKLLLLIFSSLLVFSESCSNLKRTNINSAKQILQNQILGEAFLIDFEKIKLYDKINGKEIGVIQNDYENELYYSLEIYEQKNNWLNIQASANGDTLSGWILNDSYLGTYSRNYSDTLFVYLENDEKVIICSIPDYFTSPMEIIEYKKGWVKVKINDSNVYCKGGWINQNMTCSSPYTTCP